MDRIGAIMTNRGQTRQRRAQQASIHMPAATVLCIHMAQDVNDLTSLIEVQAEHIAASGDALPARCHASVDCVYRASTASPQVAQESTMNVMPAVTVHR